MYKRILCLILSFFFVLFFNGCQPENVYDAEAYNVIAYDITLDGFEYREYVSESEFNLNVELKYIHYVDDYDSLQLSYNSIFDKYDESYFENNFLVFITIQDRTGNKYAPQTDSINLHISRTLSVFEDVTNWTIVLEANKELRHRIIYLVDRYPNSSDISANKVNAKAITIKEYEYLEVDLSSKSILFTQDCGYLHYFNNVEDLQKLGRAYFDKYDETFFEENSLILLTIKDSPLYREYYISYSIDNVIIINRRLTEETEYKNYTVIIEVDKEYENFPVILKINTSKYHKTHTFKEYVIVVPTCLYKGYKVTKCECGESLGETILDEVECKYENGRCIWCGGKENK